MNNYRFSATIEISIRQSEVRKISGLLTILSKQESNSDIKASLSLMSYKNIVEAIVTQKLTVKGVFVDDIHEVKPDN